MSSVSTPINILVHQNIAILDQGLQVLDLIDSAEFTREVAGSGTSSSVGKHFRHVLNFYQAITPAELDTVDYDNRVRHAEIEQQPAVARKVSHDIRSALELWLSEPEKIPGIQHVMIDSSSGLSIPSSVERELKYVLEHSIHHFALIGLILRQRNFELPEGFGVAPSTIAYHQSLQSTSGV